MALPNAEILEFSQEGIKKTRYQDTEHFLTTKYFLNNPDMMLDLLLERNNA